jgi:hypothetical protein
MTTKLPHPYPSPYRYYLGATGVGIGVGIAWTQLFLGDYMRRFITKPHAIILLYSMVAAFFFAQVWMLWRWEKQMKIDRAELAKMMIEFQRREDNR